MKDCVMQTVNQAQENCGDILAEAKEINENRAAEAEKAAISAEEPAAESAE